MNWLIEKFRQVDGKDIFIFNGKFYTYDWLFKNICEKKKYIKANLGDKYVIALESDYSSEVIGLFLSLIELKKIVVPINQLDTEEPPLILGS